MAKTEKERQKTLRIKRKAEGWKQMWIPPLLVERVRVMLKKVKG